MLSLKNPFKTTTAAPSPIEPERPTENDPNRAVKRWELEHGRTRKRLDALTADLAAARRTSVQAHQQLGECLHDELDLRAPTEALKQAEDRVQALEAALIVAKQKDDAAQIALQAAERAVTEEARQAVRVRVQALAPEGVQLHAAVKEFSERLTRETEALRLAGGNEQYLSGTKAIVEQFELFLTIAVTGNRPPDRLMKYTCWADCVSAVCNRST